MTDQFQFLRLLQQCQRIFLTLFHKFYDACSIKYAETPELQQARLLLCEAARQGISNVLHILKVTCPESM